MVTQFRCSEVKEGDDILCRQGNNCCLTTNKVYGVERRNGLQFFTDCGCWYDIGSYDGLNTFELVRKNGPW